ncbi:MAG: GLUG motif-containing protein, partial [Sedimentisphaerales bacterium]
EKMATSRKSQILLIITVLITICSFSFPVYAKYSGGTGEPNDPYQIASADDLLLLGESPEDYDKHFILTADIDLAPNLPGRKVFDRAVIAPDVNETNEYFDGTPFTGVFDGNGHTISNLTIEGGWYLGLFGYLGSGTEVRNLGVVDVNITGVDNVGGLVGYNYGGAVTRCYSTGAVSGDYFVGGLVGYNSGTVTQCYSSGMVNGSSSVGGLVGGNSSFQVATLTSCYSTAVVTGDSCVGGLLGINGRPNPADYGIRMQMGAVIDCWSAGPVFGNEATGGLVGYSAHDPSSWYPLGRVSCSFWDIQTSGQASSAGGTGKSTSEMQTASTFFVWDTCANEGIWTIDDGRDYPRLAWEHKAGVVLSADLSKFLAGSGSEGDPYLISTAEQLNSIGLFPCEWDKHFKLMADIDLSAYDGKEGRSAFNIIGPYSEVYSSLSGFTGVFDGNGHTIFNLTIMRTEYGYLGLFGQLASGAEVKDLGVVDVNIVGSSGLLGALVGTNQGGTLTRCYSSGAITGTSCAGGLVGFNSGVLNECYSTASVHGGQTTGGLVGGNGGDIVQCYSTSIVSGRADVGGLIGGNSGTVIKCWSTGSVSGIHSWVGGLVGRNTGVVTQCCSTSEATGDEEVGGLVGSNWGDVLDCYSSGAARGSKLVGGLVGQNGYISSGWPYNREEGTVTRCYSVGWMESNESGGGLIGLNEFGSVVDSFWDTQTSGQASSAGGTGKTTAEMQTASTFLDAGWDFIDETANGTEDIWWILEGQDYPHLWWELIDDNAAATHKN